MKSVLFLSIFSISAFASDYTKQIWSKGNDHYLFNLESTSQFMLSENCFNEITPLEKSTCDAAKAMNSKTQIAIDSREFIGGKNPGAVLCSVGLKKKIIILKDSHDNENSFCVFEDQSMISAINLQSLIKD